MGNRRRLCGLLGILLLVSLGSVAADLKIEYRTLELDGHNDIEVTTPLASYVFSEDRGVLKSVLLLFAPYGSDVVELIPGTTSNTDTLARRYIDGAEFPFSLAGEGLEEGRYTLEEPTRSETGALTLVFRAEIGDLVVRKQYTLYKDALYTVDVAIGVENPSAEPIDLDLTLVNRLPKENQPTLAYMFDGEPGSDPLARGSYFSFDGLGLLDNKMALFLAPSDGAGASPLLEWTEEGRQRVGVTMIAMPGTSTYDYSLYAGRRRHLAMAAAGLAELDDPGVGARLMIPVIQFLNMLYRATGNYGWAIILFTILTRLILFPLMRKQYHSMAKMQKLQPKLKRLQERFKDDRQLQQKKTIELYRKEGVNPMGGCLPMVVQLPLIFIIWRGILYASEQIHLSPSFLWIPDLSLHDPLFILVIVTTLIMLVQQWLMPTTGGGDAKGGQKYIGYVFPIFMAVLLWKFPAGLWLYYLLTTGAQVAQQAIVNWEMRRADLASATLDGGGSIELEEDEGDGSAEA